MVQEGYRLKEVSEILNFFPVNELQKIPQEVFTYINDNKDEKYEFEFDTSKKIYEQDINPDTIAILIYICKEYIYNGQQNDFLNRLEQIDIAQYYKRNNPSEYNNKMFGNKK